MTTNNFRLEVLHVDYEDPQYVAFLTQSEMLYVEELVRRGDLWDRDGIIEIRPQVNCEKHGWTYCRVSGCKRCYEELEEKPDDIPWKITIICNGCGKDITDSLHCDYCYDLTH